MLLYIWMCVMAQAFFPAGHTLAVLQAQAYEAHLRAELEAPQPMSELFGAAGHIARYQTPKFNAAI